MIYWTDIPDWTIDIYLVFVPLTGHYLIGHCQEWQRNEAKSGHPNLFNRPSIPICWSTIFLYNYTYTNTQIYKYTNTQIHKHKHPNLFSPSADWTFPSAVSLTHQSVFSSHLFGLSKFTSALQFLTQHKYLLIFCLLASSFLCASLKYGLLGSRAIF